MKVWRYTGNGIDGLRVVEEEMPQPEPGQVVVRMRAAALNYRDVAAITGVRASGRMQPGVIPVADGAGEVVAAGSSVRSLKVGDNVAGLFWPTWMGGKIADRDRAIAPGNQERRHAGGIPSLR